MRAVSVGILSALMALTAPDGAAPARRAARSAAVSAGWSIGSPNGGRLDGGSQLVEAPYLRVLPFYADSSARWGLPSLVTLLDRAARRVARRFPDAVLSVGDLSRKGGGELDRHRSHESGRDADVGFYMRGVGNKPMLPSRFVTFAASGQAPALPGALFDDARNWALVEALLDDGSARVSHIFVAAHIRARLLRHAEQTGVAPALRLRAAEVMMQPRPNAHDDHFHVRIGCPPDQQGKCVEDVVLPPRRVRPLVARPRERSGTDGELPLLPAFERENASPATASKEARSPSETGKPSGGPPSPRPLANAGGVDNVEP